MTTARNDEIHDLYTAWTQGAPGAEAALLAELQIELNKIVRRQLQRRRRYLDPADIDDLIQELMIEIWRVDLAKFDPARGALVGFISARVNWRLTDAVRNVMSYLDKHEAITARFDQEEEGSHPDERLAARAQDRRLRLVVSATRHSLARLEDAPAREAVEVHDLRGGSLRSLAQKRRRHPSSTTRARQRGLAHLKSDMALQLMLAA